MNEKFLIGLDFGSDSVRAILVNRNGQTKQTSVQPYRRWMQGDFSKPEHSQFRQHPLDYLESMESVLKEVVSGCGPQSVAGIGIDTTGSTPCPVARDGTPLALLPEFKNDPDAMFLLWKDHTAAQEAREIDLASKDETHPDYTRFEGGVYSAEWFWAKILHILRTNQKIRSAAYSWVEHCDWIAGELAGITDPHTLPRSRCAAGHKAMWHESWGGFPPDSFFAGIDPLLAGLRDRFQPFTATAEHPVGRLSRKWADKLGLSTETVVAGSGFDCHFGAVGAGIREGQLVKVIGTSTCDIMVSPPTDRAIRGICGQVDGSVLPGMTGLEAGQSAFGDIFAWFRRFLEYAGPAALSDLDREAALLPVDPEGVLALDWFNGRRSPDADASLKSAVFGLNLGTTPPRFYRALMEGACFGAKRIADRFTAEGIPVESVTAIGGIPRKSPFLMQTMADILNRSVSVAESDQVCALGGAVFAAAASGIHPDVFTAMRKMKSGTAAVYHPNPETANVYRRLYGRYLLCADAVEKESRRRKE